jgi:hypothetical protein
MPFLIFLFPPNPVHLGLQSSKELRAVQLVPWRWLSSGGLESEISPLGLPLDALFGPGVIPAGLLETDVGSDLVGADELLVLVDDGTAETALEDDNRGQHEAGTDLDETQLRLLVLEFRLVDGLGLGPVLAVQPRCLLLVDLVAADPDFVVGQREAHDVVDEWLDFARALGDAEDVKEDFLEQAEMWCAVEGGVKGENWTGALEAVAGEVEFLHGVD